MKKESTQKQIPTYLLEALAIATWFYIIVKLFIFDFDAYLVAHLAPNWQWMLNLRFFGIAIILSLLWLTLGHKRFFVFITFITFYPFIVLFWKIPKILWRKWTVFVVLLPTIYTTVVSLRSTFVLYTAAAVATVVIALSRKPPLIIPSMFVLGIFLAVHLYRAFRRAHSSSVFSQLATLARKFRENIDSGSFDHPPDYISTSPQTRTLGVQTISETPIVPNLYILHVLSEFIAQKIATAMKDRKYNALLVISLLYAFAITTLVFGLENWALYRIDAASYRGVTEVAFLQFLAYSLGHLATANLTVIQPMSVFATALAAAEVFCGVLILVIGAFSILTAARDTYRDDLNEFREAVHETAKAIDNRLVFLYEFTAEEIETALSIHSVAIVNIFRKIRGLDELPEPEDEGSTSEDNDSTN